MKRHFVSTTLPFSFPTTSSSSSSSPPPLPLLQSLPPPEIKQRPPPTDPITGKLPTEVVSHLLGYSDMNDVLLFSQCSNKSFQSAVFHVRDRREYSGCVEVAATPEWRNWEEKKTDVLPSPFCKYQQQDLIIVKQAWLMLVKLARNLRFVVLFVFIFVLCFLCL